MVVTEYSIFMAVLWSSMVSILFSIGLKKRKFIMNFGITSLIAIYVICFMRLLTPLEPRYVKIIGFTGVATKVYKRIFLEQFSVLGIDTTISYLMLGIWIVGILVAVIYRGIQYSLIARKVERMKKYRNTHSEKILAKVQNRYKRKLSVEVWKCPAVEIPMGFGIFYKTILLPMVNFKDEELYYILLHEYTHFIKKDIEIKILLQIFCCIFWWNPCAYLLKRELENSLEIRCDLILTRFMKKKEKVDYLETIISVLENVGRNTKSSNSFSSTMLFQRNNDVIIERFHVISDSNVYSPKPKIYSFLIVILLSVTMAFTYVIQFQARFEVPVSELSSTEEMTPENSYIIENDDGTYTIVHIPGGTKEKVSMENWLIDAMLSQGFKVEERK